MLRFAPRGAVAACLGPGFLGQVEFPGGIRSDAPRRHTPKLHGKVGLLYGVLGKENARTAEEEGVLRPCCACFGRAQSTKVGSLCNDTDRRAPAPPPPWPLLPCSNVRMCRRWTRKKTFLSCAWTGCEWGKGRVHAERRTDLVKKPSSRVMMQANRQAHRPWNRSCRRQKSERCGIRDLRFADDGHEERSTQRQGAVRRKG